MFIVAVASARIASTYKVFNFTIDEPAHIACGIEWLDAGVYRYEVQHPPLARVVAALGVHYAGNKYDGDPNMWMEGFRLLGGGKAGERGLVFGRAAELPFFWIASAVVFLWARRLGGAWAAVVSLILFTALPPILAHAGLITTDMALTAFTGAAFLAALYWAEKPALSRAVVLGILTGLALLSKFSAIPFLLSSMAFAYLGYLVWRQPGLRQAFGDVKARVPSGLLALAAVVLTVWAGYRFSFGMTDMFPFRVPAPELISGIEAVLKHNREGHISYLFGVKNTSGFWYYYPAAFAVKTPLAMLVLLAVALVIALKKRFPIRMPLLFSFGILIFAMLFSNINIGIRHVLPVYIGLSVAIGVAVAAILRCRHPRWISATICLLLVLHVLSGALQHPDYLSYTNELFWSHPERALVDSDLDWGQDMKRLGSRMKQLGVRTIYFNPFNQGYVLTRPFVDVLPIPPGDHPPQGWTAVSVTMWKLGGGPRWLDYTQPDETIGRSILLFDKK